MLFISLYRLSFKKLSTNNNNNMQVVDSSDLQPM